MIYVPNGAMSSGVITNYSKLDTRRIEWNLAWTTEKTIIK